MSRFIKHAIRKFLKHPGYSIVNVVGLTFGLAFSFLIFSYVYFETSYDTSFKDQKSIYRLGASYDIAGNIDKFCNLSRPVGPSMKRDYAGIEAQTRIAGHNGLYTHKGFFDYDQRQVTSDHIFFADSTFFDVFQREFLPGSNPNPLATPNSVVLTEKLAQKIFGTENPINQQIDLDGVTKIKVTAVIKDLGFRTHLPYEALLSWDLGARPGEENVWIGWHTYTYLKFKPDFTVEDLKNEFPAFADKYMKATIERFDAKVELILQPISSIHLNSDLTWEAYLNSSIDSIYILSAIGIFLLLIGIINYVNLSTARSGDRTLEVGVRKTLGSSRKSLIQQFLLESVFVTTIASLLGLILILALLPSFNNLTGLGLSLGELITWEALSIYLLSSFSIGILAGLYPAYFLSKMSSSVILKGRFLTYGKGAIFRKILVTLQFSTSVVIIIATTIVLRQLNFMGASDLGFDSENVMVVKVKNQATPESLNALLSKLKTNPNIVGGSISNSIPGVELNQTLYDVPDEAGIFNSSGGQFMQVDGDFLEMIGMEIKAGRDFTYTSEKDRNASVLLNEAAVAHFGWADDPVGKKIGWGTDSLENRILYEVIGIVKDFHVGSMHNQIQPIAIFLNQEDDKNFFIRLKNTNLKETMAFIEKEWSTFDQTYPMEYNFLEESYEEFYESDQNLFSFLTYISVIILLVSSLGLLSLVSFSVSIRKREISVRRVLGSTSLAIHRLLGKEYVLLLAIAFITGGGLSWYFLNQWLSNFHYRIGFQGWEFVIAFASVAVLVFLILFGITRKVIASNPSEALRTE
ncbi:MAG: FtsX-like permease family protein [Cyclobacteriaceae bacterium]